LHTRFRERALAHSWWAFLQEVEDIVHSLEERCSSVVEMVRTHNNVIVVVLDYCYYYFYRFTTTHTFTSHFLREVSRFVVVVACGEETKN